MSIIYHDILDSSNREAQRMIESGSCSDSDVVSTGFQTFGRGQQGNTWYSLAGENMLFSIVHCPKDFNVSRFFEITQIASVTTVKYLFSKGIRAQIKWPNDILIQTKKIAGILIENTISGNIITDSVIGIGLNVNASEFPNFLQHKSTSMYLESSENYNVGEELEKFIGFYQSVLQYDKFRLKRLYHKYLYAMNQPVSFKFEGITHKAINAGVNDRGQIIMIMPDHTTQHFNFKEIEWIV